VLNYYQHHLGDYAAATLHLSWDEDCAYRRLLDQYYKREAPIPADLPAACRLARASTPVQRSAVEAVLREFFTLTEDGWVQAHCVEAIATFQQGEPERQAAKANRDARATKHREQRAALFKALQAVGQYPSWNTKIDQLRELLRRHCKDEPETPVTPPRTPPVTGHQALPLTAPVTPVTASHSQFPIPIPHSDSESVSDISSCVDTSQARAKNPRADVAPRKGKKSTEQGTRVPEPFELSEDMRAWAQAEAPDVELEAATTEFLDYWRGIPGAKGRKLDWPGTWRNRMRDLAKRARRTGNGNGSDTGGGHESKQLKAWRQRKEALRNA